LEAQKRTFAVQFAVTFAVAVRQRGACFHAPLAPMLLLLLYYFVLEERYFIVFFAIAWILGFGSVASFSISSITFEEG